MVLLGFHVDFNYDKNCKIVILALSVGLFQILRFSPRYTGFSCRLILLKSEYRFFQVRFLT